MADNHTAASKAMVLGWDIPGRTQALHPDVVSTSVRQTGGMHQTDPAVVCSYV